jgi:hypothetical protein
MSDPVTGVWQVAISIGKPSKSGKCSNVFNRGYILKVRGTSKDKPGQVMAKAAMYFENAVIDETDVMTIEAPRFTPHDFDAEEEEHEPE